MRRAPMLSDVLATPRSQPFVGREREIAWFTQELERAMPEVCVWWLYGPPGVGKTTLLEHWLRTAKHSKRSAVALTQGNHDPVEVMAALASQLASQGTALPSFERRYQVYTRLWKEIQADPAAPRGIVARRRKAAQAEVASSLGGLATLAPDDLATYLRRRYGWSPAEIALALDGPRLLTDSFVAGLSELGLLGRVFLAFDEWDRAGPLLTRWLPRLLAERAEELPVTITWIVAGRNPPPDAWAPFRSAMGLVPLAPLAPVQLSSRIDWPAIELPLWLDTLLGRAPDEDGATRLLATLPGERERGVLLAAAIPRRLDSAGLGSALDDDGAAQVDDWLASLRDSLYVEGGETGLRLRATVREALLRFLRRENPLDEAQRHMDLAEASLPPAERLYHRLMALRASALPDLLAAALDAAERDAARLPALAEALLAAAGDSESPALVSWATRIRAIFDADDPVEAARILARTLLDEGLESFGHPLPRLSTANRTRLLLLLGQSYEGDDWKAARACYAEVTGIAPRQLEGWFYLGRACLALADYEAALAAFARAERLDPDNSGILHARVLGLRGLGRLEDAMAVLDRALTLDPDDPDLLSTRGELLALRGEDALALAAFDAALARDRHTVAALAGRGEILSRLHRYPEALSAFERALQLVPDAASILSGKGEALRQMKRFAEAVEAFERALALRPDDAFTRGCLGKARRQMNRFEEALAAYDAALALQPADPWGLALRAETLLQLDRLDEALATLDEALGYNPAIAFAFAVRGEVLREMGDLGGALAAFDRALEIDPDYAWALASKGQTLRRMGRYNQALAVLESALRLAPADPWVWAERGETLRLMGRFDDARLAFERAVALDRGYAWAWSSLAQTLRALNQLSAAREALWEALTRTPDVLWLWAEQAELLLLLHHYVEAASAAHAYAMGDPESDWAQFLVAVAACLRGQRGEFESALAQAIALAGATIDRAKDGDQQAWALFNRGLYHLVQGNLDAASHDYRRALALDRPRQVMDALEDLRFVRESGLWRPAWDAIRAELEGWLNDRPRPATYPRLVAS